MTSIKKIATESQTRTVLRKVGEAKVVPVTLVENKTAARDNAVLRCGDCMHFKNTTHPLYNRELCVNRGVTSGAVAPACYTPNVSVYQDHDMPVFRMIAGIMTTMTPSQMRVMMGMMKTASRLERTGFKFMQKVYFKTGDDYLSNYFSGYVLSLGIERTLSVIGQRGMDSGKKPAMAMLMPDNVYSVKEFSVIKEKLIRLGRINDPATLRKKPKIVANVDYEPPTLDTAQDMLEEKARGKSIGIDGINAKTRRKVSSLKKREDGSSFYEVNLKDSYKSDDDEGSRLADE